MSYLTSIGVANPAHQLRQSQVAEFMVRAMGLAEDDARKLRAVFRMSGIETRHSVLSDYSRDSDFDFYPNTRDLEPFPSTSKRLMLFKNHAAPLSKQAIEHCLQKISGIQKKEITHLIVVSCTGMYAPGLDIDLIKMLGLPTSIERIAINFMGCYAAFNALKLANTICETGDKKVLIVCAELCSIHFQKKNTEDNMLANALFADGAAALLVESAPRAGVNLKPSGFYCDLAPEGEQDMAWSVGDLGFEMRLSAYVPEIIRGGIHKLIQSLLAQSSHLLTDVSYFAIHPGGKKILEAIENELGLTKEQNCYAYEVLRRFGNMSSPTVLFVLSEIWEKLNRADDGKKIMSIAFGPGLTLESMILKIENH